VTRKPSLLLVLKSMFVLGVLEKLLNFSLQPGVKADRTLSNFS